MSLCPCGSGLAFENCCQPVLENPIQARTALQLMRARYTAYVMHRMDFVLSSTHPDTRDAADQEAMESWSHAATWTGLEIISPGSQHSAGDDRIEFKAYFQVQNVPQVHHERSLFRHDQGQWWFVDGQDIYSGPLEKRRPYVKEQHTGRNDPCPCGSGKKFKKCCA